MTDAYNRRIFRMAAGGMMPPAAVQQVMDQGADEGGVAGLLSPEQEAQIYQEAQNLPPEVLQEAERGLGEMTQELAMEGATAAAQDESRRSIQNVDAAGDFRQIMNAVWDEDADIEAYRDRLASVVGPEDASRTPDSVLALIQPTLQLAEIDQGVGSLMQEELAEVGGMGGIAGLATKGAIADSMAAETGALVNAVGNLSQGAGPVGQEDMAMDPMMMQAMMQGAGPTGQGMV